MRLFRQQRKNKRVAQSLPWYAVIPGKQPRDAEVHWDQWIAPNLSIDQKALLAEHLFGHIWSQQGSKVAMNQVLDSTQLLESAQDRFDQGCRLWSQNLFEPALVEIEKSRQIQLAQGSWCSPEMEVQLYYATGTIHLGLEDCRKALAEFRQAWRLSGLTLGADHVLTKSSQHMTGIVLSEQGCGTMEIHHELTVLRQAIAYEKEGDNHREIGDDLELAVYKYRQSILEYRMHQDRCQVDDAVVEQAAIRCKIAIVLEELGRRPQAETEWATSLSMYQSVLGSRHPKTIDTMTKLTRNHALIPSIVHSTEPESDGPIREGEAGERSNH